MLAIEFEADVEHGMIKIPREYIASVSNHIKVIALMDDAVEQSDHVQYSDEYLEKHWRELIVQGLSHYDESYYKSEQYMLDRGKQGAEKYA